ncbi:hypothetical protein ACIQ34_07465 [Ureibacillus sp. NPDC094379]
MCNQSVEYNGRNCLDLALRLLIQVGKLYESVVNPIMKEENHKELYELLEKSRYKERSAISMPNLYRPFRFNASNCLGEAILYLVDLEILEHAETLRIIEQESYVGLFKLLDRRIQQYNNLYSQISAM